MVRLRRPLMACAWFTAGLTGLAAPAIAQDQAAPASASAPAPPISINPSARDRYTVGLGVGITPSYEGSNDYNLIPGGTLRAQVSGIRIFLQGTALAADLIPQRTLTGLKLEAGPVVGVRLNRNNRIQDDVVRLLPRRKAAFEVGGFVGIRQNGVAGTFDSLGARLTVVHDVGGIHESTVFTPSVDYSTLVGRRLFLGVSASADFVGNGYGDSYFSISPAESARTGLDSFDADGGFKSATLATTAGYSLSRNPLKGWSLFGVVAYSRLAGDFQDSPIVADRGSANQLFGAFGLAYSF